ncbi:unnamed protein product, partial [Tuber aestivum]
GRNRLPHRHSTRTPNNHPCRVRDHSPSPRLRKGRSGRQKAPTLLHPHRRSRRHRAQGIRPRNPGHRQTLFKCPPPGRRGYNQSSGAPAGTAYVIHISGTGIPLDFAYPSTLGKLQGRQEGVRCHWRCDGDHELPGRGHIHRDVDRVVVKGNGENVKMATACPPVIYGHGGRGAERGTLGGFRYCLWGANARWCAHVDNLTRLYLVPVEAVWCGGGRVVCGVEGYYFTNVINKPHSIRGELSKSLAAGAKIKVLLETESVVSIPTADPASVCPYGPLLRGPSCAAKHPERESAPGGRPLRAPWRRARMRISSERQKPWGS